MRILIIGAVAGGTSAAAKARRNCEESEIVIYERDEHISYSACGMPYYLGGQIKSIDQLAPRDPLFFKSKYNVDIFTGYEVVKINPENKTLTVKNLATQEQFEDSYDKLVIATGATAFMPPIQGIDGDNVFKLRSINDTLKIEEYIKVHQPKSIIIVGSGFVGLEVCENIKALGIEVTIVERLNQVTPGLDSDMSTYVEQHLIDNGVKLKLESTVQKINAEGVVLASGETVPGDMVLMSVGVRPAVELAKAAGIELGETGAIKVSKTMETNIPHIYACGDCSEQFSLLTGKAIYRPLGTTANKTGRIAGENITGGNLQFRGILGTGIFQVFNMTVALTGLSEREAKELGYDTVVCHNIKNNKPGYMGGKEIIIKGIADKATGRLLGVQIVGEEGVDKRIDVFVTAITYGALVEDLFHLDLAYAPPFSTTKDPVMYTGMILENAISKGRELITPQELSQLMKSDQPYTLIDARTEKQYEQAHIDSAQNIPPELLRGKLEKISKDNVAITYCNKGTTGNAAQNILLNRGVKKVYNISGGHSNFIKLLKKLT